MNKKVYIVGKITGNENYKKEFEREEHILTDAGFIVLNPAILPEGMNRKDYMRICFSMIDCADNIVALPNWKESEGAKCEIEYCKYIGKTIGFEV